MDETSKHFNKCTYFQTSVFELTWPFVCTPLIKYWWSVFGVRATHWKSHHSERLSGEFPLRSFSLHICGVFMCVCVCRVCAWALDLFKDSQMADEVTSAVTCKHSHKYINKEGIHGRCCVVYHCITYGSAVPAAACVCVIVWCCIRWACYHNVVEPWQTQPVSQILPSQWNIMNDHKKKNPNTLQGSNNSRDIVHS